VIFHRLILNKYIHQNSIYCLYAITNTTDINLTVIPIKKNGTTGVTIGYQFRSEFKNQKTITKIEDVKIIDSKPRSNRQQLSNWGVSIKDLFVAFNLFC
jgi:hypothetical protein